MTKTDLGKFTLKTATVGADNVSFYEWKDIPYVRAPADKEFQSLNIFVPEAYCAGGCVNGYTAQTAPIFVPNEVGGYMPGERTQPGVNERGPLGGTVNSLFGALKRGYVVVSPSIRGRTLQSADGKWSGKAPALIVDMKAVVRFIRHLGDALPGDKERIITNGTSAGGALSALAGATGNDPAYIGELEKVGAWDERDDIFAASCYCPITDLEHADMAYEWEFGSCPDYHRMSMKMEEGGRPSFTPEDGVMTGKQMEMSKQLRVAFPAYVNGMGLKDTDGSALTLNEDGTGSFRSYVERLLLASAQTALDRGLDLSDQKWLKAEDGHVVSMDLNAYAKHITRMKCAPAFDSDRMDSPENHEFGTEEENYLHFTEFALKQDEEHDGMAQEAVIRMMNPLSSLKGKNGSPAKHWRIRVGEKDRDTSHAVSAILALTLLSAGCEVDIAYPWDIPHAGDYDLPELFDWIDSICRH